MKVGPISAGADPGPACEDKGGQEPTLTDAFVLTGVIDPNYFLGGEIKLKPELSEKAYRKVADEMHMSPLEVAFGAIEIATANMVNAIKLISVRRGYDPRDFTLIAFGGGGPMFSTSIAEELGLKKVVIGRVPGVFSAWGMLMTDLRHDYIQTKVMRFEKETLSEIRSILEQMKSSATEQLKSEGIAEADMRFEPVLDIRYSGQEHTVTTPAPEIASSGNIGTVQKRFNQLHRKTVRFHTEGSDGGRELEVDRIRARKESAIEARKNTRPRARRSVRRHSDVFTSMSTDSRESQSMKETRFPSARRSRDLPSSKSRLRRLSCAKGTC